MRSTLIAVALLFAPIFAHGTPVLSFTDASSSGTPVSNSLHGWLFSVNTVLTVTHLGLFDRDENGMTREHEVGLFRYSDGSLLTSGTMSLGKSNMLIDGFRYTNVFDVELQVGKQYMVAYYTDHTGSSDGIHMDANVSTIPEVDYLSGAYEGNAFGLAMPVNLTTAERIGPNFLVTAVPIPAAVWLFGSALAGLGWLRRK